MMSLESGKSNIPLIMMDEVFHVGTFEEADKTQTASLEAFCLSVSIDPEEWKFIARIGGAPTWKLSRPNAKWLDASSLLDDHFSAISDWGLELGLITPATIYRAYFFDDESDSICYFEMDSRMEADLEVEGDPSGYIEEVESFKLTNKSMSDLQRWGGDKDYMGGLIILWADQVLSKQDPDISGIWWNEDNNPQSLSCPRGGILPSKIAEFERVICDPIAEPDLF